MRIKEYILYKFPVAYYIQGVDSIENELLYHNYLVVLDDNKDFMGILTPCDIIKRPRKLVIDSLTEKSRIDINDSVFSVFNKFDSEQTAALPVFDNNRFRGVIEKKNLIEKLILKKKESFENSMIDKRIKDLFLRNLSHELRTPLNSIIGFLDILSRIPDEEYKKVEKDYFDIIRKNSNHFLMIMKDLIDISLLESGYNIMVYKNSFSVEHMLLKLKDYFDNEKVDKTGEIEILYENPDPSFKLYSDEEKLKHILYHLIDNAIKFSESGNIICGWKLRREKNEIEFFVSNTGERVALKDENVIFEVFEKGEYYGDKFTPGLGIGLSIVKRYSELLGGRIYYEHELKRKTTFFLILPVEEINPANA